MLTVNDIICYIPVYNDAVALERCLTKLDKLGIQALVIDGRFTDFPQIEDNDVSTDQTMEVATSHHAHYVMAEPMREQNKFNLALEIARERGFEVFMYCGADAYYEGDIDEFMMNLQRFYEQYAAEPTLVCVFAEETQPDAKWNNTSSRQPRIIFNYWKMEARHLHWTMYEKGAPDTQPLQTVYDIVEGIKLYHDNTIRPKERDDMMTAYQNHNVPREREMFMEYCTPKAYDYVKILPWRIGVDGSYEDGREKYFDGDYSHLLVVSEGYDLTDEHIHRFENVLEDRNRTLLQLPIITAVWKSRTKPDHFTLNPDGEIKADFPKYPKVERLYSPDGLSNDEDPILVAPYTAGPAVCMGEKVVYNMEHMGDNLDFLAILLGLGYQIHADARIQF
jgi:hypothetical protein